jgi:hypothetical protein
VFATTRIGRADFDDATLRPLYALSNALMAEPYEHFAHHARTNDELYVFRRDGELVGFQLWRAFGTAEHRYVLGGKLRIDPSARRHGLHLAAGLDVLAAQRRTFPEARISRLSIASLFGFVSIARRLAHFTFVDATAPTELADVIARCAADSHYVFDRASGRVDVGIRMTAAQLEAYPAAYFESELAREYIARNPDYRDNGCYLAFAFEVDRANLAALAI